MGGGATISHDGTEIVGIAFALPHPTSSIYRRELSSPTANRTEEHGIAVSLAQPRFDAFHVNLCDCDHFTLGTDRNCLLSFVAWVENRVENGKLVSKRHWR
jgi:hypothetical protein